MIEKAGFRIRGMKMVRLSKQQAEGFYDVHRERPFFAGLVTFMTEGPVVVLALERENAIKHWRDVMGATNPANAAEGTIRKAVRQEYRAQCRARVGRARNCRGGNPILFQHVRIALVSTGGNALPLVSTIKILVLRPD